MFVSQPEIPVPLVVEFPFPAWATRPSETTSALGHVGAGHRRRVRRPVAMRLLHTADWHVGKVLKGVDRLPEQRAVLAEIVGVAAARGGRPRRRGRRRLRVGGAAARRPAARLRDAAGAAGHRRRRGGHRRQPRQRRRLRGGAAGVRRRRHHVLGRPGPPDAGGVVDARRRPHGRAGARWRCCRSCRSAASCGPADLFGGNAADANDRYARALARIVARLTAGFDADAVNVLVAHGTVTRRALRRRRARGADHLRLPRARRRLPARRRPTSPSATSTARSRCRPAARPGTRARRSRSTSARRRQRRRCSSSTPRRARRRGCGAVELTTPRRLRTVTGHGRRAGRGGGRRRRRPAAGRRHRAGARRPRRRGAGAAAQRHRRPGGGARRRRPSRRPSRAPGRTTARAVRTPTWPSATSTTPAVEALFAELLDAAPARAAADAPGAARACGASARSATRPRSTSPTPTSSRSSVPPARASRP